MVGFVVISMFWMQMLRLERLSAPETLWQTRKPLQPHLAADSLCENRWAPQLNLFFKPQIRLRFTFCIQHWIHDHLKQQNWDGDRVSQSPVSSLILIRLCCCLHVIVPMQIDGMGGQNPRTQTNMKLLTLVLRWESFTDPAEIRNSFSYASSSC